MHTAVMTGILERREYQHGTTGLPPTPGVDGRAGEAGVVFCLKENIFQEEPLAPIPSL